jgi:fatty-acyl-CoA synthase
MPPFRNVTVGDLLSRLATALPDREALVYSHAGLRWTFAELEAEARLIARGLIASGVEPGERVAVWATNVPEWIVLQFALAKIGAILVTVNTSLRAPELDYLLRQSEAGTVITIRGFRDVDYVQVLGEIGALGAAVAVTSAARPARGISVDAGPGGRPAGPPHLQRIIFIGSDCPAGLIPYESLRRSAARVSEADLDAHGGHVTLDAVINMQYTSGTTGFPKGVMLSSRNIVNNAFWLAQALAYTPADRLCLCVPLFHCFGCVIGVLGAYTHGVCLCPVESFDARRVLETVERERCTALYGVPTMFLAELEDPEFPRFDLRWLRTGIMAGAPCPEPLMRRVINEMHLGQITIAYGLTETSPGITVVPIDDTIEHRTQTVGRVLPDMEVKVVDPVSREEVGLDQPGELWVRGYNVMKGYYNNPEATRAAIVDDGWLRSGDQATIDREGYVRITGRIKDLIIRGGENIAPKEIEDVLRQHPAVADVYVYAVGSERLGEEVAAAIRLRPGAAATAEEIVAFCDGRLARFKRPRHVRFVSEFPMTASGKVQKFRLRELHERELARLPGSGVAR